MHILSIGLDELIHWPWNCVFMAKYSFMMSIRWFFREYKGMYILRDLLNINQCSDALILGCPIHLILQINTMRQRQNGIHFTDNIFKCIFVNEKVWISIEISLKFVPGGQINNIPKLVETMAWRWPGNKTLSEPKMVSWLMHICIILLQSVNKLNH